MGFFVGKIVGADVGNAVGNWPPTITIDEAATKAAATPPSLSLISQ